MVNLVLVVKLYGRLIAWWLRKLGGKRLALLLAASSGVTLYLNWRY